MHTIYHLESAQDISADLLESIKSAYQSKPITITVEEDATSFELSDDMKAILDARLEEDEASFITANESLRQLNNRYGI